MPKCWCLACKYAAQDSADSQLLNLVTLSVQVAFAGVPATYMQRMFASNAALDVGLKVMKPTTPGKVLPHIPHLCTLCNM